MPSPALFETHDSVVEVPLIRAGGDPRSRVAVTVGSDHDAVAILDLTGAVSHCGWATAQRLGLKLTAHTTLATLQVGAVRFRDLPVDLGGSDDLVLGVGGWSDVGVAVLPSRGVVQLGDDADAVLASVGFPVALDRTAVARWWERGVRVEGPVAPAVAVMLGDQPGLLRLESARSRSVLGFGVLDDQEVRRGGAHAVWSTVELGGVSVPGGYLRRDESVRDPRPGVVGVLGADLLATLDFAVDPVQGRIAVRAVEDPQWSDVAAEPSDEEPADDGADERAAGDRCDAHLALGLARLRSGEGTAVGEIERAAALYAGWEALDRRVRDRVREGKSVPDGLVAIHQICDDAPAVLARVERPPYQWSEREIRDALAVDRSSDPVLHGALAVRLAGRADRSWVPSEDPDAHPLTTAFLLGDLGEGALDQDPRWLAGRALLTPDDPPLVADARLARAREPGDRAAECLYALVSGAPIPDDPEADCATARWLAAERAGDVEDTEQARAELTDRWPDLLFAEPIPALARTDGRHSEEDPMIPMLALAATALADSGPFDQTHAQLGLFLKGAVTDAGRVDYAALKSRRATLDGYLAQVKGADLTGWSSAQKLALYVNAYNAYTLATMLDGGPPASIQDLDGGKVWDTRKFVVAGESLTLNDIENGKARPLADGRVHSVLNCASKGCPPLSATPLTAVGEEAQLDAAARRWVKTNAYHLDGTTAALSEIFDWYSADFAKENKGDLAGVDGKPEAALWFLARFTDDPKVKATLTSGTLTTSWQTYDWSNNSL